MNGKWAGKGAGHPFQVVTGGKSDIREQRGSSRMQAIHAVSNLFWAIVQTRTPEALSRFDRCAQTARVCEDGSFEIGIGSARTNGTVAASVVFRSQQNGAWTCSYDGWQAADHNITRLVARVHRKIRAEDGMPLPDIIGCGELAAVRLALA